MEIIRNGSQEAIFGPEENFTGSVRIDWMFNRPDPSRLTGAIVTFQPGARPDPDCDIRGRLDAV